MSAIDNIRHDAEQFAGRAKQSLGRAIGSTRLEREGRKQRLSGRIKRAGQNIKDAFRV